MGTLTPKEQKLITEFVFASQMGQAKVMVSTLEQMGLKSASYNTQSSINLENSIRSMLKEAGEKDISRQVAEIFRLCGESGLTIDLAYLQLVKGLATLEGTINSLSRE